MSTSCQLHPSDPPYLHLPPSSEFNRITVESAAHALVLLQQSRQSSLKVSSTAHGTISQTHKYLERLGIDISTMNFIHVAGSKGKGSTSTYVESLLCNAGYTTGLYTSPNLVSITERFRINTKTVPDGLFLEAMWAVWDRLVDTVGDVVIETIPLTSPSPSPQPSTSLPNTQPTTPHTQPDTKLVYQYPPYPAYFQFLTLVAFFLYKMLHIDVVVMEVGLGGRVDATNVINPLVTAITTLSLEHTEILGSTLDRIAYSKTGIFKPNVPIVVFPQKKEAWDVILQEAKKVGVTPVLINPESSYNNIHLGIPGEYQPQNANLAVLIVGYAIKILKQLGVDGSNSETKLFAKMTSLTAMHRCVQNEFICDSIDDSVLPSIVSSNSAHDADNDQRSPSSNIDTVPTLLQSSSHRSTERSSINQYVSSDVYLLQTLRTFNSLIENVNPNGETKNEEMHSISPVEQGNHAQSVTNTHILTTHPPLVSHQTLTPTQSLTQSPTRFQADPIVDPNIDLDHWVDRINHDTAQYQSLVQRLGLNRPHEESRDDLSMPPLHVEELINQLNINFKLSIVAYHQPTNYLTFHTTTITPSIIRALCTTTLRARCDTIYNTFTYPFLDPISSHSNLSQDTIVIDPTCGCPKKLAKLREQQHMFLNTNLRPENPNAQQLQALYQSSILWHIDGAHTPESITSCTHWYQDKIKAEPIPITIQRERVLLLDAIKKMQVKDDCASNKTGHHLVEQSTTPRPIPTPNRTCVKVVPLNEDSNLNQHRAVEQLGHDSDFTPFQQKVLMFNCGHVRSPFLLLKPLMDAFFDKCRFKQYQSNLDIFQKKRTELGQNTSLPTKVNLPFFEHIFFCPFDLDKPTDVPLPSLVDLFQQNDLATGSDSPNAKYNFGLIPDLVSNGSYLVHSREQDTITTGSVLSATSRPFKPQVWQFQTMAVLDHLITQELCLNHDTAEFDRDHAVLYTLRETTQSTQLIPSSPPSSNPAVESSETTVVSTNTQYNTMRYFSPLSQHPQSSHPPLVDDETQHPFQSAKSLPFTPPIATLARSLPLFHHGTSDGEKPSKDTVFFHVMTSSRDTVMAVQYLAVQHHDQTHPQNRADVNSRPLAVPEITDHYDTTTRALVVGSLYLAGNVLQYLKCKV